MKSPAAPQRLHEQATDDTAPPLATVHARSALRSESADGGDGHGATSQQTKVLRACANFGTTPL